MVQLLESEILTKEVLQWQGLHILHARMSSCSQKLRIFLNLKGIDWQSRELNLGEAENYSDWFLGINPRGLVPVMILDGAVHIESNDILTLLEKKFPEPCLIPPGQSREAADLLTFEDDLHIDLRTLSFRFVFGRNGSNKTEEMLARYQSGERTVAGLTDSDKRAHEVDFYQALATNNGITDAAAVASATKFRAAFEDLEERLSAGRYFLGNDLSLLDIAWFVYVSRLKFGGYPFECLHARVHAWHQSLAGDERFSREVLPPGPVRQHIEMVQMESAKDGKSFSQVTGF